VILTEVLAILSLAAATGLRLVLPLLLTGLMVGEQIWQNVPLLSHLPPSLVLGMLVSLSVAELLLSKQKSSQRFFQILELILSPLMGAVAGVAAARTVGLAGWLVGLLGLVSALLAMVIQLLQVGWFYRPRRPPAWLFFAIDGLCIALVFLAFDAPRQGGLIALLLLWLVIRCSTVWRNWPRASQVQPPHLPANR